LLEEFRLIVYDLLARPASAREEPSGVECDADVVR